MCCMSYYVVISHSRDIAHVYAKIKTNKETKKQTKTNKIGVQEKKMAVYISFDII